MYDSYYKALTKEEWKEIVDARNERIINEKIVSFVKPKNKNFHDCTGETINGIEILYYIGSDKHHFSHYMCKCHCGNKFITSITDVKSKHTKSCGCYSIQSFKERATKHGLKYTRIYGIWQNMLNRCRNPNVKCYAVYGGRGIYVCDEWKTQDSGFINFYNWSMSNGYTEELTIDRIDVNGPYSPDNCRWVSWEVQILNKRNSLTLTYNDINLPIIEWSKITGIPYGTIYNRMQKGWTPEQVLRVPLNKSKNSTEYLCWQYK